LGRQLGTLDVFAVAAGAMISSGLFVLPAIAYAQAGPAVVLSYVLASILVLPTVLSKAELATAMPRAGGTYFYVERSLGAVWGLFGGFAGWFSLALKSAFAIVGMAVLAAVVLQTTFGVSYQPWHLKGIAVLCCLLFAALNIVSVKSTMRIQIVLVALLLLILGLFIVFGTAHVRAVNYEGFLTAGWGSVLATAGLVFISFGGLTKAASIAEEVKNPGRNLVVGMFAAWLVVTFMYVAVVAVVVGVLGDERMQQIYASGSLMPVSFAAKKFAGTVGFVALSIAAMAAFVTTANGGILAASRGPMAMSRDQLLPPILSSVNNRFKTPHLSILLTCGFMAAAIVLLDIEKLVKSASALMLSLFILDNASVIVMRESRIQSYRPQFKSPLYPYVHIAAIIACGALIVDMGTVPLLSTGVFVLVSLVWFLVYVRNRVGRASAAMHVVERVTDHELKTVTLENELRDILLERDNVIEDRFDRLVRGCDILDIKDRRNAEDVFRKVSSLLCPKLDVSEYVLLEKFLHREAEGGTIVQPGFAIPHIVVDGQAKFEIVLVRAKEGIAFPHAAEPVRIMFVLAGTRDERNYHLRVLMAIAQIAQEKDFEKRFLAARDAESIRNLILLSARKRDQAGDST